VQRSVVLPKTTFAGLEVNEATSNDKQKNIWANKFAARPLETREDETEPNQSPNPNFDPGRISGAEAHSNGHRTRGSATPPRPTQTHSSHATRHPHAVSGSWRWCAFECKASGPGSCCNHPRFHVQNDSKGPLPLRIVQVILNKSLQANPDIAPLLRHWYGHCRHCREPPQ